MPLIGVSDLIVKPDYRAEKTFNDKVNEARKAHDAVVSEAHKKLVEELDEEKVNATKKGNLDGAIAIRERLREIANAGSAADVIRQKAPIIGPYRIAHSNKTIREYVFARDGAITFVGYPNERLPVPMKSRVYWHKEGDSTVGYHQWSDHKVERFVVSKNGVLTSHLYAAEGSVIGEGKKAD